MICIQKLKAGKEMKKLKSLGNLLFLHTMFVTFSYKCGKVM
jgi:hypothetical protein